MNLDLEDPPIEDDAAQPGGLSAILCQLNKVVQQDCMAYLQALPSEVIDCTVTSPPYFQQRSYLPEDHELKNYEIGCSLDLKTYLDFMTQLFVVLLYKTKKWGTCWVNIGDTWVNPGNRKHCPEGYRVGEKLGVPHKLADAIRAAGWRLISEVVWHKPNANPHSPGKHPVYSHEMLFQFAKSDDSYYDPYPLQELASDQCIEGRELYRHARSVWTIPTVSLNGRKLMSDLSHEGQYRILNEECPLHGVKSNTYIDLPLFQSDTPGPTCTCEPFDVDFFASMPPKLAENVIVCSTSEGGNCPVCGQPSKRMVLRDRIPTRPGANCKVDPSGKARKDPKRHVTVSSAVGWRVECGHQPETRVHPVVFDPFMGSGTTALAALRTGRDFLGCELNPMMVERLIPARLKGLLT